MQLLKLNKPILDFAPGHPARRFLEAFVKCRRECVGRELEGVDQQWFSEAADREYDFSSFAYEWLSFDVELDGWLQNAPGLTDSEQAMLDGIAQIERLMAECKTAAVVDNNWHVVAMCNQVLHTTQLWAECINSRLASK